MMTAHIKTWLLLPAVWLCAALVGIGTANAYEIVRFESATYPPTPYQAKLALQQGKKPKPLPGLPLNGRLTKPDGEAPFPAVVLMHGCGGIWRWNDVWSARLTGWGYVVLDVDSFGPRGKSSICDNGGSITGEMRALDAYGANTFLSSLPLVDPERIAVLGMSHGGWAVLNVASRLTSSDLELKPFQAAVALYPWCDEPTEVDTPLLVLTGELDDWSPVERCRAFAAGAGSSSHVALKVYPGAHHLFDLKGIDERQDGHILRYDQQAADDAIERIKAFLAEHL